MRNNPPLTDQERIVAEQCACRYPSGQGDCFLPTRVETLDAVDQLFDSDPVATDPDSEEYALKVADHVESILTSFPSLAEFG